MPRADHVGGSATTYPTARSRPEEDLGRKFEALDAEVWAVFELPDSDVADPPGVTVRLLVDGGSPTGALRAADLLVRVGIIPRSSSIYGCVPDKCGESSSELLPPPGYGKAAF